MEKQAVTNTSSLIFIGKLRLFDLTKNVFDKILVPTQVMEELLEKDSPENLYIKTELGKLLREVEVKKIIDFPLHPGEKSAISLCLEKNIKIFLSDDKRARRYAISFNIEIIGVIGIILQNLQEKYIKKDEAKSLMHKLIQEGYHMNSGLYSKIMRLIDEK